MDIQNPKYWNERYLAEDTPWDIGGPAPALIAYCRNNISDKSSSILIPGGGRAHEMTALFDLGYKNVFLCDWSEKAIEDARRFNPEIDADHFFQMNFFDLDQNFDLILEQTFFCALAPEIRKDYVQKAYELLKANNGTLAGLFFDICFDHEGPPFGGSRDEYIELFSRHFDIESLDWADQSIEPREGTERFLIAHVR